MNVAMILAGGVGNRFGADIPKQFVEVFGKPVLAYTIEKFEKHQEIDAVLVVCIKSYINYLWKMKDKYNLSKIKWITEGGDTFQNSVFNGVCFLEKITNKDDIVVIHFGASPFITEDIISDCIKVCKEKGNAISTTDYYVLSGKKANKGSVTDPENYSEEYIDREIIAVMNSPHAFKFGFISDLYKEAIETGAIDKVEPHTTTLMYTLGKKVYFSKGSQTNIKITTKEDLNLFEGYILEEQKKRKEIVTGEVVVFFADGFEESEGLLVVDLLRRASINVVMASTTGKRDVKSSRGILIQTDCLAENVNYENAQMIVLPGGRIGTENLKNNELVKKQCIDFAKNKHIAAICSAPTILASLGLLNEKRVTVHPDFERQMNDALLTKECVTIDKNIITGQGLGTTIPFALELINILVNKETAERIRKAICYNT